MCRAKVAVEFKVVEVVAHLDAVRPASIAVCTARNSIVCVCVFVCKRALILSNGGGQGKEVSKHVPN